MEGQFTARNAGTIMSSHCGTSDGGVRMIKKSTTHGNSLALVLDRGVLDLQEIEADTPLNIKTDRKCLIVTPAHPAGQRKFRTALAKANRQYGT